MISVDDIVGENLSGQAPSRESRKKGLQPSKVVKHAWGCMQIYVPLCVCVCVPACARTRMCVCVCGYV